MDNPCPTCYESAGVRERGNAGQPRWLLAAQRDQQHRQRDFDGGIPGPDPASGFAGFESFNTAAEFTNGVANSFVTLPELNLNTNTITLSAWIYPIGTPADYCGLVFCRPGADASGFDISTGGQLGYTWNQNNSDTYSWLSGLVPPLQQWSFVALVISPYNAVASDSTNQPTTAQFVDYEATPAGAVAATLVNPNEPLGPSSRKTGIVISEIMYKPAPRTDSNNVEFLEVYNSCPFFQDISSYQLTCADMNYTFPAKTLIPGGGFFVLASLLPASAGLSDTEIGAHAGAGSVFSYSGKTLMR
jgi:hypothetical protein